MPQQPHQPQGQTISSPLVNDACITGEPAAIAEQWFQKAVQLQTDGHVKDALNCYQRALRYAPEMAEAYYNMGLIYAEQQDWARSMIQFKKVLELKPDFVDAAFQLAVALHASGQYQQAIAISQMTLDMAPDMAKAHFLEGLCYLSSGVFRKAASPLQRATSLDETNPRYWFHLAEAHLLSNQMEACEACYCKVIDLRPTWDAAHYNLALALRGMERFEEAIEHLKIIIQRNPDYLKAYPLLFLMSQQVCDWRLVRSTADRIDAFTAEELARGAQTTEPPLTNIRRQSDVRANLKVARSWSRTFDRNTEAMDQRPRFLYAPRNVDRLRVGYLSGDFKDHAVAHQIRGLLEHHDRSRFEIFGYASNPDDGTTYRRKLAGACDHFRDMHAHSPLSFAQHIKDDGIHILVDMAGHSKNNRMAVVSMRPAPIQVSYLGFLSTTGADFIDYVLADRIVVPHSHQPWFSEKVVYLPHCYQANDDQLTIADQTGPRSHWGLPDSAFVFCSFNQPYKIDADLFQRWMHILSQVEQSVLWLVERGATARQNLRSAARHAGVDPARLIFANFVPIDQNLARLQLADLVLDTLIYNGGATTANALWAGVPVVSALGDHWVSRMSASALHAVDLPECIAADRDEYTQLALSLALHPKRLRMLRERLQNRRKTSPLFKTALFTQHVEKAYTHMWDRFRHAKSPVSFQVEP